MGTGIPQSQLRRSVEGDQARPLRFLAQHQAASMDQHLPVAGGQSKSSPTVRRDPQQQFALTQPHAALMLFETGGNHAARVQIDAAAVLQVPGAPLAGAGVEIAGQRQPCAFHT